MSLHSIFSSMWNMDLIHLGKYFIWCFVTGCCIYVVWTLLSDSINFALEPEENKLKGWKKTIFYFLTIFVKSLGILLMGSFIVIGIPLLLAEFLNLLIIK